MDLFSYSRRSLVWLALLMFCLLSSLRAGANPTGGSVTHGSATFSTSGSTFNINQSSASASINWQSFNVGLGETVNFNQPSASSVTFNQINQGNASQILGDINANGYVVLQNANGFYIGGQAVLTVHGLIMTTASTPAVNLGNGGPWSFDAPPPTARIQNFGQINITGGGTAYLIAADIVNNGSITAPNGQIGLYDGETVLVSTSPNAQGLSATVTLPQGSVDNEGKLTANGGSVVAQAQFVNQNGIIQANTAQNVNGTIELLGSSSVALGANSAISAQGSALGVSAGGSVTIRAGDTFSDQAGSTINISGGAQGGNGGQVELSAPVMGAINTVIDGQALAGFNGGALTLDPADIWLDTSANNIPSQYQNYTFVNIGSFSGMSQINLQSSDNIVLNTTWNLSGQTSISLTAGTGFVPTAAQPTPASGSDGIYLMNSASLQTQYGSINLWAANEVQVGWSGSFAGAGIVNAGSGSIRTVDGGNIRVTTLCGDVNSGSDTYGFDYKATAPYCTVDPNLGGISTAAGGNVTITAGRNVISYSPSGNLTTTTAADGDGGTGAFGSEAGNVTITAGGTVYGHYVVANGIGTILAGQNVGAATGAPFALSLINGGWNVNAPNGNIYLQEVRNPNGDFNNVLPTGRGSKSAPGQFFFNYSPQAYVDLTADGVYLTGQNVPRLSGLNVPVLYPPILEITAGAGGVTLEGNVTLFPSVDQNLDITTADGGNFTASANLSDGFSPYELLMSDSSAVQWQNNGTVFTPSDNGGLAFEPNDLTPVSIDISGSMNNLELITSKITDIFVGGNMINCGFSGQNLQASDVTRIYVTGQIYNTSSYSFVNLSQAIPAIPAGDLLQGEANSWDAIFTLAVNPSGLSTELANLQRDNVPVSEWANQILGSTSLFQDQSVGAQLVGANPGFVYNTTTGRLGFIGPMSQTIFAELTQPITILHLVNGQPVINPATGQIETDNISWAGASALNTLYTESQGNPSLSQSQLGYRIGGPGQFDVEAGSISLGNSDGILSGGIYDQNGLGRYSDLAPITPVGATINVTVTGPDTSQGSALDMLTSTIASLDGGDVNVLTTGGSMDLGSSELVNSSGAATGARSAFGIYTTGGGNVNVTSMGNLNIDGSRIATYDGGNIVVQSLTGNVNIGNGSPDLNTIDVVYTGENNPYLEDVFGSGILAETLVPAQPGSAFPNEAATAPGNITVNSPEGSILTSSAGIIQEALDGSIAPGPSVSLTAGTPNPPGDWNSKAAPLYVGNIDLGDSGVIGGTVNLSATGNIIGQIVSRQNSTVNAGQSFSGTLLSGGSASLAAGGSVSGTIVGVGGANVSGAAVTAAVLGQNVSVNGGASQSTLGASATATASTQAAAQQASSQSQQQVASDQSDQQDDKKKKNTQIRKVGRVTVILASAS